MKYVIVGNGVAGVEAARTIRMREPEADIFLVSSETNWCYSRTALMYLVMGDMRLEDTELYPRDFYNQLGIRLVNDLVVSIDRDRRKVHLENGGALPYDRLLLATGARAAMFDWPGQSLAGVVNMIGYPDVDAIRCAVRPGGGAVVCGAGLIGVELAEVFAHTGMAVTFLMRGESFWPAHLSSREGDFVITHMRDKGIAVQTGVSVAAFLGEEGQLAAVRTTSGEEIPCSAAGVAVGVRPALELAEGAELECAAGVVCDDQLRTADPAVYTAGDCAEVRYGDGSVIQRAIWYTARDMGRIAGENMCGGSAVYTPGDWYNSAKFFDLEYTAAGRNVPLDGDDASLHLFADDGSGIIRVVHAGGVVRGFSLIGGRWDHALLLRWIEEGMALEEYLCRYREAWFAPELVRCPEYCPEEGSGV